mgnify:FL=1|tara:strand:- start:1060 stop:1761 length:702 start_codon:yes stop_codon:yes gene_type:complete
MARISKYTYDNNIVKEDFLLGTDFASKQTRNFSIEAITAYLAKQQSIQGTLFALSYDRSTSYANLAQGNMSFNNNNVSSTPFSGITDIYVNKLNNEGENIENYLQKIKDKDGVLALYNSSNVLNFGVFRIQTLNNLTSDVIQLSVDVLSDNGTITDGTTLNTTSVYANADKHEIKTQTSNAPTWDFTHTLNKYPSVSVVDSGNNIIYGDVEYISTSRLKIHFSSAQSGKAYLN